MEEWAAKNNINLNELYGVNTRYEVAEVVNPEDELTPAEKRIRNRCLRNQRKGEEEAKLSLKLAVSEGAFQSNVQSST